MLFDVLNFITDFADQAVILPLILCVAVLLWGSGWRRGALVWCVGTCATLGVMLVLKLGFRACGPELFGGSIESPSGHTAAAGAVYGSIFAFLNLQLGGRKASRWLIVLAVVVLIGTTRVVLGAHNLPEAYLGGALGFIAAQVMLHTAGKPTLAPSFTYAVLPVVLVPLLLHGFHLKAENQIMRASDVWPLSMCRDVAWHDASRASFKIR